jgi:hypothetical protein
MAKILFGTWLLLLSALPATAQLHYPEYTEKQVDMAANKVCKTLNNGITKTRSEATLLAELTGSMFRDIRGRENEYSSFEDKEQSVRNSNRVILRLNQTCQAPLNDG